MRFDLTHRPSDSEKHTGHALDDLERHLDALQEGEQFQLWMFKDDGESACCLCNRTRAWLTIISKAGDDLLSVDAGFVGDENEVEEILLENGQLDEMPRRHCIARAEGIRAAIYYFREGVRAPFISWFPS
jgi:hypothetical protein